MDISEEAILKLSTKEQSKLILQNVIAMRNELRLAQKNTARVWFHQKLQYATISFIVALLLYIIKLGKV